MKKNLLFTLTLLVSSLISNSQTPITDANFSEAIETCLGTNPIDGLCSGSEYGAMPSWDVSNVTDMSDAFYGKSNFNADISAWDVSNVTDMHWMFVNSGFNQPIGSWDVSNVTTMSGMFYGTDFNQTIGNWNMSNVTNLSGMFEKSSFNQPINDWDVSSVTNMQVLFAESDFNQSISNWDLRNVTDMISMFEGTELSIENYDALLNGWSSLGALQSNVVFSGGLSSYCDGESGRNVLINSFGWVITDGGLDCPSLTPLTDANIHGAVGLCLSNRTLAEATYGPVSNWDTSNVTDMSDLFFQRYPNFDITGWDVSNVTDMSGMFALIDNFDQSIGVWDVSSVTNMSDMFLETGFHGDIGDWDVSNVTDMSGMFHMASFNQPIGNWDVSSVTDMSQMFAVNFWFSQDISNWDVSNVTDMSYMFSDSVFNQPIGNWDVSSVTNMRGMFGETRSFNQDISSWDVSSVTNMSSMFSDFFERAAFNQNIGNWDVSNVSDMDRMFWKRTLPIEMYDAILNGWSSLSTLQSGVNFGAGLSNYCLGESGRNVLINSFGWVITDGGLDCSSLTPLTDANIHEAVDLWVTDPATAEATYGNISNWDTSNITNMSYLFSGIALSDNIGNWDVSSVTDMSGMFSYLYNLDIGTQDIGNWDVSSVTNMSYMFKDLWFFNSSIENWNVSSVTDMSHMFSGSFFNDNIGNWDVSSVTNMSYMFSGTGFDQDIGNWDVSSVTDMSHMFKYGYFNKFIGNWDMSSVIDMSEMFADNLDFNQPIDNWDVSNVTNMSNMFWGDNYSRFNQPLDNWDVSSVTDMSGMFGQAGVFNQPIGNWDVSSVTDMSGMFHETEFNQDIGNWDVSSVTDMSHMFARSYFDKDISNWDVSSVMDMSGMFSNATLSTTNYDNLLIGWASLSDLQPNVSFRGGSSTYCSGESARDYIINTYGWTIDDAGKDCTNAVNCLTVVDAYGFLGVSNAINLRLESYEIIKGFQFDITFPDGFVFDPNDITNTGLPENFQVSCANVGGNAYRVVAFSLTNETIASGTTSILTFPTLITEGTVAGDYPIPVTNVTLSDVNNVDIATPCSIDGVITFYSYPMGDANGDYAINILDILGTVDFIFNNPPSMFYFELADVNFDANINILDVLGIQDIILSPTGEVNSNDSDVNTSDNLVGENYLNITDNIFAPNTSETIEINLVNDDIVKGMEFDFVLPESFTFNPTDIVESSRLNGFTISAQEISANTYKVLVFSLSSATIAPGSGVVLELPVFIEPDATLGVYPIAFTNVILSDINNTDISTTAPSTGEITISILGVDDFKDGENILTLYPNPAKETLYVTINKKSSYAIYDLSGKLIKTGNVEQGENKLDISNYQSGIYYIQIKNELGFVTKKVIKN